MSKASAGRATQLLKFGSYKTTVIHALQLYDPASMVHFCSWFLNAVVEAEINPQLTGTAFLTSPMIVKCNYFIPDVIDSSVKFVCTSEPAVDWLL
jgi:hypothetical protein